MKNTTNIGKAKKSAEDEQRTQAPVAARKSGQKSNVIDGCSICSAPGSSKRSTSKSDSQPSSSDTELKKGKKPTTREKDAGDNESQKERQPTTKGCNIDNKKSRNGTGGKDSQVKGKQSAAGEKCTRKLKSQQKETKPAVKRKCTVDTKPSKKLSKSTSGLVTSSAGDAGSRKSKENPVAKKNTKCEQTEKKRKTEDGEAAKAGKGAKKRTVNRSTSRTSSSEPTRKRRRRSTSRS